MHWQAVDGITKTAVTLALAVGALSLGAHLGRNLSQSSVAGHLRLPRTIPPRPVRYALSALSVLIYVATIPVYVRMPHAWRHQATAALLFSYPGTLARYLLSVSLNARWKALPLGTLAANALGTALLGLFHILQNKHESVSPDACSLLQGLGDGFCGCLTTVSTFAAELVALEERKRWRYLLISFAAGQLLLLVMLEPSFRAGGVRESRSCSFT
jgi:fluoride exporter